MHCVYVCIWLSVGGLGVWVRAWKIEIARCTTPDQNSRESLSPTTLMEAKLHAEILAANAHIEAPAAALPRVCPP